MALVTPAHARSRRMAGLGEPALPADSTPDVPTPDLPSSVNDDQLSLFDLTPPPRGRGRWDRCAETDWPAEIRALGERLPAGVRFGTSSWSFPGWAGLVSSSAAHAGRTRAGGPARVRPLPALRHRRHRSQLLRAARRSEDLKRYAAQLPDGFPCCAEGRRRCTPHPRAPGQRSRLRKQGNPNPDFLSAEGFLADVFLAAVHSTSEVTSRAVRARDSARVHAPEARLDPLAFPNQLGRFLEAPPRTCPDSVELRNRGSRHRPPIVVEC